MSDRLVRGILRGEELIVLAATATDAAREARRRHGLASTSAQLLGQGLLAGALLSALQKGDTTRINLQLECDGPARGFFVDADTQQRVRGYVRAKHVAFPAASRFDAGPALGTAGQLSVLRDIDGTFYRGTVALEHRDLSRDLEHYFSTSEQLATTLQLEALGDGAEPLGWVGGVLLQALPSARPETIDRARARLAPEKIAAAVTAGHATPAALIAALFGAEALESPETAEVQFWCPCSRARVLRALQTLGPAELFDMIHKEGKAEAACDFCGLNYVIEKDELQHVLDLVDQADAADEAAAAARTTLLN